MLASVRNITIGPKEHRNGCGLKDAQKATGRRKKQ